MEEKSEFLKSNEDYESSFTAARQGYLLKFKGIPVQVWLDNSRTYPRFASSAWLEYEVLFAAHHDTKTLLIVFLGIALPHRPAVLRPRWHWESNLGGAFKKAHIAVFRQRVLQTGVRHEVASTPLRRCSRGHAKSSDEETIVLFIDGDQYFRRNTTVRISEALAKQAAGCVVRIAWFGRSFHGKWKIDGVERNSVGDEYQAADLAIISEVKACDADSIAIATVDKQLVQEVTKVAKDRGQGTYYL
eukprot:3404992-Amphidinium_carterae.1